MEEPLLLEFYSFVIGFCFGNLIHGMLVCDLRNYFCLIFLGGAAFLLEMEQYPAFWRYDPPLSTMTVDRQR